MRAASVRVPLQLALATRQLLHTGSDSRHGRQSCDQDPNPTRVRLRNALLILLIGLSLVHPASLLDVAPADMHGDLDRSGRGAVISKRWDGQSIPAAPNAGRGVSAAAIGTPIN
jgi:hypothetical protein